MAWVCLSVVAGVGKLRLLIKCVCQGCQNSFTKELSFGFCLLSLYFLYTYANINSFISLYALKMEEEGRECVKKGKKTIIIN